MKYAEIKWQHLQKNATLWNYMKRVFLYLSCNSKEFSQSHLYNIISLYHVLQFVPLVPLLFYLNYVILLCNAPIICKLWTLFKYNQSYENYLNLKSAVQRISWSKLIMLEIICYWEFLEFLFNIRLIIQAI